MTFWAPEDTKQNYIKIHTSRCHCRDREKPQGSHWRYWWGPFTSYADALAWVKTSRKPADDCKFCKPQLQVTPAEPPGEKSGETGLA